LTGIELAHFLESVNALTEVSRVRTFKISIVSRMGKQFESYVRSNLHKAHPLLRTSLRELSVALVGDAEMSALHERFLGIAGPTDVLTFPLEQDESGCDIAGEVVVCVPEARRQAKLNGNSARQELLLYALHGMLHLSGFGDRTPLEFRKMHRKEDEILRQLGVGPVFHTTKRSARKAPASARAKAARNAKPIRRVTGEF
jgi:probable rRNA maturation factor